LLLLDEVVVVETLVRVSRVGGGGMQHLALSDSTRSLRSSRRSRR
jgi:hypothetical protein